VNAWSLGRDDSTVEAAARRPTVLRGHDGPVAAMVLAGDKDEPILATLQRSSGERV
jgi:hypothetical protein